MMSEHSPGPWGVRGCVVVDAGDNIVARVFGEDDGDMECVGNLRLVALAPTLLALVRRTQAALAHECLNRQEIDNLARDINEVLP